MATVQSIIDRATFVSKDTDRDRWTVEEMLAWLNDAAGQIASLHPRAASQYVMLPLADGSRQDLRTIDPDTHWIRLHEITCNGIDGAPDGPTVRIIPRPALDAARRTWRADTPSATIKEYAMDEREPFTFDVNPPALAGAEVYALVAIRPAPFSEDDIFPLAAGFEIPAMDYLLFRMFTKDANDQSYTARASGHLQAFQLAMGIETSDASVK